MQQRILMVLTGVEELPDGDPTGFETSEAARPYRVFRDAGYDVEFATPDGTVPRAHAVDLDDPAQAEFVRGEAAQGWTAPRSLADVRVERYDAVYFPGGHGTMWDFAEHPEVERVVREAWTGGKVVAAVCHGPAALANVRIDGVPLVQHKRVCCFTDAEEREVELDRVVPFLLETRLRREGADIVHAPPLQECVVTDGNLVTGQNPASSRPLAEAVIALLVPEHAAV